MNATQPFARWDAPLPPLATELSIGSCDDAPETVVSEPDDASPQSISGFVCVIEYRSEGRFITGRRYDVIGDFEYVGAICHTAESYRQFRCDRISAVMDAYSGEVLGDGSYFRRFDVDSRRDKAPTWGLTPGRKRLLVAGLNILAFMARCDGRWHPLEDGAIERFICSMWLRKEWPGDPPLDEIIAHAQRLAPDSDVFFRSLTPYAASKGSTSIIRRAVADLIDADGVVCASEFDWAQALDEALTESLAEASDEFLQTLRDQGVIE